MSNQGTNQSGGPEQESIFCLSKNTAIVDGDSSYNRRHGKGHFKGESYPFEALVDFMPQSDVELESVGNNTIQGVFIGYRVNAGGL